MAIINDMEDKLPVDFFNGIQQSTKAINDLVFPQPPTLKPKQFIFPGTSLVDLDLRPPSQPKQSAWSLLDDSEGLNRLCQSLIKEGRLEEALRCKQHSEKLQDIQKVKEIKSLATEREDYETAIQYRNILNQLERELCKIDEVRTWTQPSECCYETLEGLEKRVHEDFGEDGLIEFTDRFKIGDLQSSNDIETAKQVLDAAEHYVYFLYVLPSQHYIFVQQTHRLLQQIEKDLAEGYEILNTLQSHPHLLNDPKVSAYKKGLVEVFGISARLEKSLKYMNNVQPLLVLINAIKITWSKLSALIEIEAPKASVKLGQPLCAICLFPGPKLPFNQCFYHPPCINYWFNKVNFEPPLFIPTKQ